MPYSNFAYWYDRLNVHANYNALFAKMQAVFAGSLAKGATIADLGCGTGEMAIRFAKAGFDMVCVDYSSDMLSVFREKIEEKLSPKLLLLKQDLTQLDLYGTVQGAYCVFDTLNHIAPQKISLALARISLFLEEGSYFIFDVNSPFKHKFILANNTFTLEADENQHLAWQNKTDEAGETTNISLKFYNGSKFLYDENFTEYSYSMDTLKKMLQENSFVIENIYDGELFGEICEKSQRYLFITKKQGPNIL